MKKILLLGATGTAGSAISKNCCQIQRIISPCLPAMRGSIILRIPVPLLSMVTRKTWRT